MAGPTAYPLPYAMEAWDNRVDTATRRATHSHGGNELLLVRDHGITLIHRGLPIEAPPGTLVMHCAEEDHGVIGDGTPVRLMVVNWEPDERFEGGFPCLAIDARRVWRLDDRQMAAYIDLVTRIQAELDGRNAGREHAASAWLRLLLVLVARLDAPAPVQQSNGMQAVDEEIHRLRRAIDLRRQGSSNSSLHDMVDNYDALRQRFRRTYGESPSHMLMRLRMEVARGLLTTTDDTMAEIAQRIGYARQHEFARAFHRVVGCTPTAFRRQHRGR